MEKSEELIRYAGGATANLDYHHGQLRPAVGVRNVQVIRANRTHPEKADGFGWTYNHAPMLAYWNDRFYLQYLSDPVHEHVPPGQTILTSSPDGIRWGKPTVLFPPYELEREIRYGNGDALPKGTFCVMHQRMGFYVSANGRLLTLAFYGFCPTPDMKPNDGKGIGRVVREIYADGSFGPIYFIRLNRHAGWHEGNVSYPMYAESEDEGFREACGELLRDRLATLQWWEEDRSPDDFYAVRGGAALSAYRLPDGRVAGLWKHALCAVTADEGATWSKPERSPSLIMSGGKVWGERTSDSRYALVYNPSPIGNHRWPLTIVTGDDGLTFDQMLVVHGEVSPRRYDGQHKNYGPSYTRGVEAGNGRPPGGGMWIAYSVNKEDIWVSEIPVPVRSRVSEPVNDTFDEPEAGGKATDWNIYSPCWARVAIAEFPSPRDKSLELRDEDPYDFAKAERVFPESSAADVRIRTLSKQADHGQLYIELCDAGGAAPIRCLLDADGTIKVLQAGTWTALRAYEPDVWHDLEIRFDTKRQRFSVTVDGQAAPKAFAFSMPAYSLERLALRTGPSRKEPHVETPLRTDDLPDADVPVKAACFYVNRVQIS